MQQQFTVLLNSLENCTHGLLECMEVERTGLASRNMEQIEQSTLRKTDLSRELEQLESQRARLVTDLGYSNDAAGMSKCIQNQPNSKQLVKLWQQVLDNLKACRDNNLINGSILELGRRQAEQALSILRGQNGNPGLYSPDGNSAQEFGNRKLGEA